MLAAVTPSSVIASEKQNVLGRLLVGLIGSLLLIACVAYLAGRSIVGALGRLADAAHSIAAGRLRGAGDGPRPRRVRAARPRVQPDGEPARGPAGGPGGRAPAAARGERPLRRCAGLCARPRAASPRHRRVRRRGDQGRRWGRDRRGRLVRRDRQRRLGRRAARLRADERPPQLRPAGARRRRVRRRGADDGCLAGRPGGCRARERTPAPDGRAAGPGRRADRPREPAPGRRGARE